MVSRIHFSILSLRYLNKQSLIKELFFLIKQDNHVSREKNINSGIMLTERPTCYEITLCKDECHHCQRSFHLALRFCGIKARPEHYSLPSTFACPSRRRTRTHAGTLANPAYFRKLRGTKSSNPTTHTRSPLTQRFISEKPESK